MRLADKFGHAGMRAVSEACERVISEIVSCTGVYSCLEVGLFAVLLTLKEEHELKEKADSIRRGIDAVHEVEGIPCSLYAQVSAYGADEIMRLNDQILKLIYPDDILKLRRSG